MERSLYFKEIQLVIKHEDVIQATSSIHFIVIMASFSSLNA